MLKKPLKYREVFIFKINLYSVYCLVNNIPQTIDFFTLHLYKFNCKVQVVCPFQIVFLKDQLILPLRQLHTV